MARFHETIAIDDYVLDVLMRVIAEEAGLSKSAVQTALDLLRRRELIESESDHATATPVHRVLRHWRGDERRARKRKVSR